ncbi:MAG TPA: hypothetical protein VHQ90_06335 [Thermoanaerobaculia bacterium]|nr:hypothetical protein [Thermoanaerobaculia bacterium]
MRKTISLGALTFLAAFSPALAGGVFVPIASNLSLGGALYTTKVWVTNPAGAQRRFQTAFIAEGTDGTQQQLSSNIFVPAGGTVLLTDVAPAGQLGMLEVTGANILVVNARLDVLGPNGAVLSSANVPAVSQANAVAAGVSAHLQGLQRGGDGSLTNLSVINLADTRTQCTVKAFRADNSQIGRSAIIALKPLSRREFADALAILGESSIKDARFEVNCDQQFFAYATVLQLGGPTTAFVPPSRPLAESVLPGSIGQPPPPAPGVVTFDVPGLFLHAVDGHSSATYDIPAPPGVPFVRSTVELDLHITSFTPIGLFTGVMSMRRPSNDRASRIMYYGIIIINKDRRTLLDLGIQDVLVRKSFPWQENSDYHLKTTYDLAAQSVTLDVSQGGQVVHSITGQAQFNDLSASDNPLRVDFGQDGIADGAYFPPIGWSFSNLHVVLTPK